MAQFCKLCGKAFQDNLTVCPFCGVAQSPQPQAPAQGQAPGQGYAPQGQAPGQGYAPQGQAPGQGYAPPPGWTPPPGRTPPPEEPGSPAPKKRLGLVIGLAAAAVAVIAAVVLGALLLTGSKQNTAFYQKKDSITELGIAEYTEQARDLAGEWNETGTLALGRRKALLRELDDLYTEAQLAAQSPKKGGASTASSSSSAGGASGGSSSSSASGGQPTGGASGASAPAATPEPTPAPTPEPTPTPAPAQPLSIDVQQVDARAFPEIKLYLRVEDYAGNVPAGLQSGFFYITKRQANGEYIRQRVMQVTQLDQLETLNIDVVADVSGSMNGNPIKEAKRVMQSFIQSVQFEAGDLVELTTFSTGVYINEPFTADADRLISQISNLTTGSSTSLYDALYTAVNRVAAQSGAKCVIAFTDGMDNHSKCTPAQVIDFAQRYNVPIFIVGIGSVSESELRNICQQTGGLYFNIRDISDLSAIYAQVYRQEKELYLVSYSDTVSASAAEASDITVAYESTEYTGACSYHYVPRILLRVTDAEFYHTGPEEILEKYIRGYAQAQTYSYFDPIEPYLLPDSPIYNGQKTFVLNKFEAILDSYEIVSIDYSDAEHCIATTLETFFIRPDSKPAYMMTQRCRYNMVCVGGIWYLESFAENVKVVNEINQ